jgi:hypothetical protein
VGHGGPGDFQLAAGRVEVLNETLHPRKRRNRDQAFHHHNNLFLSRLYEPQRRWVVALEALRVGHGFNHLPAQITRMSPTTVLCGCHELKAELDGPD